MNMKLQMILMSLALNVVITCPLALHGQQPPIVGGYQEVSKAEPDVVAAARFAIKDEKRKKRVRLSLVSIERAETQVVAGINYKLCLRVKIKNKVQNVTTVVYRNLGQKYSLSSWEQDGCKSASSR